MAQVPCDKPAYSYGFSIGQNPPPPKYIPDLTKAPYTSWTVVQVNSYKLGKFDGSGKPARYDDSQKVSDTATVPPPPEPLAVAAPAKPAAKPAAKK